LGLAGDLVDLVDVDDARLGLLDVIVGRLDQLQEDVLDVLPHVARLGESRGVGDGEGDVEHAGQRLRQEGLAAARGAEQQDVRLLELDLALAAGVDLDAFVVVVDRNREDLLRLLLPDDVVVQELVDLTGLGELFELEVGGAGELFLDDLVAEVDAFVANIDAGTGDELLDLLLRFTTETTFEQVAPIAELRHRTPSCPALARVKPWPAGPRAARTARGPR